MKVGLVVPQFGINTTKENLIRFVQIGEKILNPFGYMTECYMLLIHNNHMLLLLIKNTGQNIL
jgi:hypothetical protein